MPLETTFLYDESLIRQAAFGYWRRTVGIFFVSLQLAFTAYFIALLVQQDLSWKTGVLGTVMGFGYALSASVYGVHYRNSLAKFRELGDAKARFLAEEDSFTMCGSCCSRKPTFAPCL